MGGWKGCQTHCNERNRVIKIRNDSRHITFFYESRGSFFSFKNEVKKNPWNVEKRIEKK